MANAITMEDAVLQAGELSRRALASIEGITPEPDTVDEKERAAFLAYAYALEAASFDLLAFKTVHNTP